LSGELCLHRVTRLDLFVEIPVQLLNAARLQHFDIRDDARRIFEFGVYELGSGEDEVAIAVGRQLSAKGC
jgi:hypothetical protein